MEVLLIILAVIAFIAYKFQMKKAHYVHQNEIAEKADAIGVTVPCLQTLTKKELKEVTEWFSILASHPDGICRAEISGMVCDNVKGGPSKHDEVVNELMRKYDEVKNISGWEQARAATWTNYKGLYRSAVRMYGLQARSE